MVFPSIFSSLFGSMLQALLAYPALSIGMHVNIAEALV